MPRTPVPAAPPAPVPWRPGRPSPLWLHDRQGAWLPKLLLWVQVILMIVPEGLDYSRLSRLGTAPESGSLTSRLLWLLLLASSGGILLLRQRVTVSVLRALNPWLPVFVVLAALSIGWAIDPGLSARRVVRLITMALVCTACVVLAWRPQRFQTLLRQILTALLAGSLLFGLLFPEYAIHHEMSPELLGAWRGLANHKNGFGDLACLGLLFWLHAGLSGETRRSAALAGVLLAMLCVVLSRSSTALANSLAVSLFLCVMFLLPSRMRRMAPIAIVVLVALLLLYGMAVLQLIPGMGILLKPITLLSGKDLTFTGRTVIWNIVADHIRLRPLLGSGYGAYWTPGAVPGTDAYEVYWRMGAFFPGSSHNGYLEILNDLGATGLLVLIAYLAWHVRCSLQLLRQRYAQAVLFLAVFFQQAIGNLTESHWLNVQSVDLILMTFASTALAREWVDLRMTGRAAPIRPGPPKPAGRPS